MYRSFTFLLVILTLSLLGPGAASPAAAATRPHLVQGRGHKKAHKAKSPKKAKPKPEASRASKKNDRGFEL